MMDELNIKKRNSIQKTIHLTQGKNPFIKCKPWNLDRRWKEKY